MECKDPRPIIEALLKKRGVSTSSQAVGTGVDSNWPNRELVITGAGPSTTVIYSSGSPHIDDLVCAEILKKLVVSKVVYLILKGHKTSLNPIVVSKDAVFCSFREFDHALDNVLLLNEINNAPDLSDASIIKVVRSYLALSGYTDLSSLDLHARTFWATIAQQPPVISSSPKPGWSIRVFKTFMPYIQTDDRFIIFTGHIKGQTVEYVLKALDNDIKDQVSRLTNLVYVDEVHTVKVSPADDNS